MKNNDTDVIDQAILLLSRLLVMMRMSSYILSMYAMVQGLLIVLGGDHRFSQQGYRYAMMVIGAPSSWGWVLGIFGLLSFISLRNRMYTSAMVGMTGCALWSFSFGGSFLIAALQNNNANLTAIAAYGKDGVLFLLTASAMAKLRHQQKNERGAHA